MAFPFLADEDRHHSRHIKQKAPNQWGLIGRQKRVFAPCREGKPAR
jgi:hypothetical protein